MPNWMNDKIRPGRYRHFKGGEYEVIGLGLHSETEQPHVIYRPLYGQRRLWVRPMELFTDQKQLDGNSVARFERIGDHPLQRSGLQEKVAAFCARHQIKAPPAVRLLDLCSELGELAKVWLNGSGYGRRPEDPPDRASWQAELGDTLFALLCLADESGVDAETALDQALERYRQRIERSGQPGSNGG